MRPTTRSLTSTRDSFTLCTTALMGLIPSLYDEPLSALTLLRAYDLP
jgi:hypothetical protein